MNITIGAEDHAAVFEWDARTAEQAVFAVGQPILNRAGLMRVPYTQYCWFLRELTRLLRTQLGPVLDLGLKASIKKWSTRGLDRNLLEQLAVACWQGAMPCEEGEDEKV